MTTPEKITAMIKAYLKLLHSSLKYFPVIKL